jgi:hypothetical protein
LVCCRSPESAFWYLLRRFLILGLLEAGHRLSLGRATIGPLQYWKDSRGLQYCGKGHNWTPSNTEDQNIVEGPILGSFASGNRKRVFKRVPKRVSKNRIQYWVGTQSPGDLNLQGHRLDYGTEPPQHRPLSAGDCAPSLQYSARGLTIYTCRILLSGDSYCLLLM